MTTISFSLNAFPDCISEISIDVPKGTTISELAELCEKQEGVNAPKEEILGAWCIVDGVNRVVTYELTGDETQITFMNQIIGG